MTKRGARLGTDENSTLRPGQPGSRLRRALDLARQAGAPHPSKSEPVRPPAPVAPTHEPGRAFTPEPDASNGRARLLPLDPAPAAQAMGASSRHGPGRGLEALLPTQPQGAADTHETWDTAAQGWVRTGDGELMWRPVVTTADRLDRWRVETYVGVVSGESTSASPLDTSSLSRARREALASLVAKAVARGGHGVISMSFGLTDLEAGILVTATGTAVTLAHRN